MNYYELNVSNDCQLPKDVIIGFVSDTDCEFDVILDTLVFHYRLNPGQIVYALNNQYIMPTILIDSYLKNVTAPLTVLYDKYSESTLQFIQSHIIYFILNEKKYIICNNRLKTIENNIYLDEQYFKLLSFS